MGRNSHVDESGAFVETFVLEAKGEGILSGLRFGAKDLIDIAGRKTSCGNPTWGDTHPEAAANAVCVDQLLWAAATCAGKTVTDELAFALNGENFFYGTPLNPKAPDRVPGGSSSGSASAVACGLVDFALGTDTGGSVRVPASNCGIFGYRPTHGAISVAGVNPLAPSFDTVGALAQSPEVLSRVGSVLVGCDIPSHVDVGTIYVMEDAFNIVDPDVREALLGPLRLIEELFPGRARTARLEDIVEEGAGRGLRNWYETYGAIQWAEIWSCLGSWVESVKPQFGPRIAMSFELVKNYDRKGLSEAVSRRERYYQALRKFLRPTDLLCLPTAPTLAPLKGALGLDRTKGDYYPRALSLTAVAGICRLPQVSLPLASVNGIPIGISLVAAHGCDGFLLALLQSTLSELGSGGG
ncbi:MAG: amidase [Deltaproteobacteria bacterium]|nr:amidase [Deltaproteobacteria bacterium]